MYLIIEILISLIISIIPTIIYIIKKDINKKYLIIGSILLLIGTLVRIIIIEQYPIGFNQDEASIAYDAYTLLHYGIDRAGNSYPVHLVAWGSGQNALYAYILLPLIKVFGLNIFSVRLPSAIVSSFTLLVAYYLFKKEFNNKGLIFLFFFTIMPWHIMKSRWALESNIFPDMIFYSITLIYYGYKNNKKLYYILSSIILGLSTYAYGTSYAFIPMFSILAYIYLIKNKKITIKDALLYLFITGLVSLPIVIFVFVNTFNFKSINILGITIPKLDYARFTSSNITGNKFIYLLRNLMLCILTFIYQADTSSLNTITIGGLFYKVSIPVIIYGIIKGFKSKNTLINLVNIFFISGIFVSLFILPNVNRINVLWIPCLIYLVYALITLLKNNIKYINIIMGIYLIFFLTFTIYYYSDYQNTLDKSTFNGLLEALDYTKKLKYNKMYITTEINQPYIFYLYSYKVNPHYYLMTRSVINDYTVNQTIERINNVYFSKVFPIAEGNIYIINKRELNNYYVNKYKSKTFGNYIVLY